VNEYKIENTIIHLLGAPGTGKYTIAREMAQLADLRLVDNHLINNPLFSIVRQDGKTKLPPRIWDNVAKIWEAVADTMVHISPPHFSFILTNALFDHDADDRKHMENMRRVATERKGMYVPIRLVITDVAEHVRRITAAGRNERMKETNAEAPDRYAAREVLKTRYPEEFTLDVTRLEAAEAARRILDHVASLKS
jgi:hypothetical protein